MAHEAKGKYLLLNFTSCSLIGEVLHYGQLMDRDPEDMSAYIGTYSTFRRR